MTFTTEELVSLLDSIRIFLDETEIKQKKLLHVSLPFSIHDPLAVLETIPNSEFSFFWERPDLDVSITAGGTAISIEGQHLSKEDLLKQVTYWRNNLYSFGTTDHSLAAPFFVGGMAFSQDSKPEIWKKFGKLKLTAPEWTFVRNGKYALLNISVVIDESSDKDEVHTYLNDTINKFSKRVETLKDATPEPDKLNYFVSSETSFDVWENGIKKAKEYFDEGIAEKLVLARELDVTANRIIEPTRFINKLRSVYPSCYSFIVHLPNGPTFLGSSPERLVSFHKNYILTEALAGTISRGKSAKEDTFLEQSLLNSQKDLVEHSIVVSEILKRLKPFSSEIQVSEKPGVRKVANVQHLHTPITAWIHHKTELLNLFFELHPTPAVGGYPKEVAKVLVPKLEDFDRGWYAAPVGWFNLSGSGEFAVAIRSGIIWENKARFYAGCGIVPDSDPMKEWDETKLKFIPMLSALEFA